MMTQGEALLVLKTGANVFLTGEPGSGKTHTVNAYVVWLQERGVRCFNVLGSQYHNLTAVKL